MDRTGLTGAFDIDVRFALPASPGSTAAASTPVLDDAPQLEAALIEQLGLQLRPDRLPIDVVVIDAVERPNPD